MKSLIVSLLICGCLSTASLIGMHDIADNIQNCAGVKVEFLEQGTQNSDINKTVNNFCHCLSEQKDKPLPEILKNLLIKDLDLPDKVKFVCNLSDENITIPYLKDNGTQLKDVVRCYQNSRFGIDEYVFSIVVLSQELGLMSIEFGDRVFPEEFELDEAVFYEKTFKFTLNCWVDQSKGEKYLEIYRTEL